MGSISTSSKKALISNILGEYEEETINDLIENYMNIGGEMDDNTLETSASETKKQPEQYVHKIQKKTTESVSNEYHILEVIPNHIKKIN